MELSITAKGVELTPNLKSYIEEKLGKLDRLLPHTRILEAKVELSRENTRAVGQRVVAQVTLNCNGTILRGEERAEGAIPAVDAVVDVIDRQARRYKEKHWGSLRRARGQPGPPLEVEERPTTLADRVVRVKRFPLKPMSLDEAIEQMELLGHDFFLFYDSTSQEYNLVYRRRDGGYGLIQPELGGTEV